ncbi:hypothetical protein TEA_012058 [Camellia sinensis var. sinensis]|uniref:SAC domain-containing protein n=1 Tax=Camellia sinensis var. sinensis TaxID=542762 RepID=A0A4V3WN87_CAMSN|nr:hypothetical protein TEA_012058 [Camellia sinensis var. sinensis]
MEKKTVCYLTVLRQFLFFPHHALKEIIGSLILPLNNVLHVDILKSINSNRGFDVLKDFDFSIGLIGGTYVLVITSRKEVGSYLGFPVFHALSMKFLSCNESLRLSNCQSKVVERHFHDIIERYGETVAVDLTDKHGDEGQLSMAYATEMEKLPNVRYISFDFHHYCGNSNLDNIQVLYDQVSEDLQKEGYFLVDAEGKIQSEQKGIIRSNCIDCLDRTNVTQSFLAQKSLNSQLQRLGVLSRTECISMFSEDFAIFKTLWVEQGDEISLEYSGTHALKRDLVRYGKQTMAGLIKDGISAISRYYLNNFQDGDAMDLMSGRYTVNRNSPSPFLLNGFDTFSYLPVASALLIGGLTATSVTFNQGMMALVKVNGRQFCSRPRLCGLLPNERGGTEHGSATNAGTGKA